MSLVSLAATVAGLRGARPFTCKFLDFERADWSLDPTRTELPSPLSRGIAATTNQCSRFIRQWRPARSSPSSAPLPTPGRALPPALASPHLAVPGRVTFSTSPPSTSRPLQPVRRHHPAVSDRKVRVGTITIILPFLCLYQLALSILSNIQV